MGHFEVKYGGSQVFTRQPGARLSFDDSGRAQHVITWRGPRGKIKAFRLNGVPRQDPDFGASLPLAKAPEEIDNGAYIDVIATYGGQSKEISANYDGGDSPDATEIQSETVLLDRFFGQVDIWIPGDEFLVTATYYGPTASVSYTSTSKPSKGRKISASGIKSDFDPKITNATIDTSNSFLTAPAASPVSLLNTKWKKYWQIQTFLTAFPRRRSRGVWEITETYQKKIVDAGRSGTTDD